MMQPQVWRRILTPGDPLRDWCYVWHRNGVTGAPMLVGKAGQFPLTVKRLVPFQWYDQDLHYGLQVSPVVPAGLYSLFIGPVDCGAMTVESPRGYSRNVFANVGVTEQGVTTDDPHALYVGCTFDRSPVFASAGLFLNCTFRGLATPGLGTTHAFSTWGNHGNPLALIGCTFDGTDRGPVINLRSSPTTDFLATDITVRNVLWIENGNEVLCVEAGSDSLNNPALERAMFLRWRIHNCAGDAELYNVNATDCLFSDWQSDRASLNFRGEKSRQLRCTVRYSEFTDAGVSMGRGLMDSTILNTKFIGKRRHRGNALTSPDVAYGSLRPTLLDANNSNPSVTVAGCNWIQ